MKPGRDVSNIHVRLAVAGSFALGAGALAAPAPAAAAWAATATHQHAALAKATLLGAPPASQVLHIAVALQPQNRKVLDDFVAGQHTPGSASYGRVLTREQFLASYAPSEVQAQAVVSYLHGQGFSNIAVVGDRMLVTADGSRSAIETAFNTRLLQYQYNGRTVHINVADAQVPASLGGVVLSVLGLQNADVATTLIVHAAAPTAAQPLAATATGHVPVDFPKIYNALGTPAANTTVNIGIIASGDLTGVLTDLRTYESQYGLAAVSVTFLPSATASTDTSGADEWDLDSQVATSMAGGVKNLTFYNAASLSDADLETDFALVDTDDAVSLLNISLGECESSASSSGFIAAADALFEKIGAEGTSVFAATGDGGAYTGCSAQEGIQTAVSYPASSPYVTAVGGTTLNTNSDGSYASETAWAGSGGGVSTVEPLQAWQASAINAQGQGYTMRAVPDIAMDGDPNSGALIIVNGSSTQVGGTSLATPLAVGAVARLDAIRAQDGHPALGFLNPLAYQFAAADPGAFTDVTSGCNTGTNFVDELLSTLLGQKDYCAAAGYDEVTGLGSLNLPVLATLM